MTEKEILDLCKRFVFLQENPINKDSWIIAVAETLAELRKSLALFELSNRQMGEIRESPRSDLTPEEAFEWSADFRMIVYSFLEKNHSPANLERETSSAIQEKWIFLADKMLETRRARFRR